MEAIEALLTRRSVRRYTADPVTPEQITAILEAARWAPSGLNNQPWRFLVLFRGDPRLETLTGLTKYAHIVRDCAAAILVFLDREKMYHQMKDYQGAGACLQNILLAAHALGLGAVWLGEIVNQSAGVMSALDIAADKYEFMAAVTVGHPARKGSSEREPLAALLLEELPQGPVNA